MLLNSDTSDQEADMEGTEDVGHVFAPVSLLYYMYCIEYV